MSRFLAIPILFALITQVTISRIIKIRANSIGTRSLILDLVAAAPRDGEHVLRARIDMASPNMNMRDPVMYRILHASHHRTGDSWCIYPTYDFTHGESDSIEGITHSICTLEFEDHRPLYDWFLDQLDVPCHPQQIEFSRLSLQYTITSKRKLTELVEEARG